MSIYDIKLDKCYLIRDIVGVKPLYYHYDINSKKFIYGSLINALLPSIKKKELNYDALRSYANFNRNDYRETFFKNVYKVLPGELIIVSDGDYKRSKLLNYNFENKDKYPNPSKEISYYFSRQFISDVPIALSLSGGIDSNIIFHELLKNKGTKFTNYSVKFKNSTKYSHDHDFAKNIAEQYGVKFISVEVNSRDFIENAEKIVDIVEEPTGNTNSISNYILSNNISEKVLFSGDGGDEIFTGYDKYKSIYLVSLLNKINIFKNLNLKFKNKNLNRIFMKESTNLFLSFSEQNLIKNQMKIYNNFNYINENCLQEIFNHSKDSDKKPNLSNVMFHDLDTWVPNDILLRNDKIYANKGIEVRVPFLDQNIINKFLKIDDYKKFGLFFRSKNLLKDSYKKELKLAVKKKLGFNSPFAGWLRQEISGFAKSILCKSYYDSSEHLNLVECNKLIKKHQDKYYEPYLIWNLISLQIFLRKYKL
jgi:asparagine synthase (glutamine-hydrolysing)